MRSWVRGDVARCCSQTFWAHSGSSEPLVLKTASASENLPHKDSSRRYMVSSSRTR